MMILYTDCGPEINKRFIMIKLQPLRVMHRLHINMPIVCVHMHQAAMIGLVVVFFLSK